MTNLTVITPPEEEPVSLSTAKSYLRIGHEGEDTLVRDLIASARARIEQESGLALVSQEVRVDWLAWPATLAGRGVSLPRRPAVSLNSVVVTDGDGAETDYTVRFRLECGRVGLRPWSMLPTIPTGGRVSVTFAAGYGAAKDVPEDLREACLRLVGALYSGRSTSPPGQASRLPEPVQAILNARREVRL